MGVKSLWSLLTPVGRPVMLETIEGKVLAIDSSIWIYQFQATMRDKDGRALVNAHVLGFLRRICKLLFYGIKPVFVFDGGAPAMKRTTISQRKRKKSGAAASHAKLAERLLAAQLRREALVQAHPQAQTYKGKAPAGPVAISDIAVYLEDIDGSAPKTPAKQTHKANASGLSKKKSRFQDYDPYRLPDIDMDSVITKAARSSAPDPRLATEEELRAFIEEMRPEDFDVTSPSFRELPTEVKYEIIGDLRLKSRQTSYKRLQNMLRKAATPLDFSREQIKNLQQRNALTQQLLVTTDSIGKANITIPVRIANERNREYVLVKNEGESGGWIMGIRDEGTKSKPIEIDQEKVEHPELDEYESEMEMEEISIPTSGPHDSDLREYRHTMASSEIARRSSHSKFVPFPESIQGQVAKSKRLFVLDDDDENIPSVEDVNDDLDPELALAIQASFDGSSNTYSTEYPTEPKSPRTARLTLNAESSQFPFSTRDNVLSLPNFGVERDSDDDNDLYASPNRLETVLSIAGAGPRKSLGSYGDPSPKASSSFGRSTLLTPHYSITKPSEPVSSFPISDFEDEMEEVLPVVNSSETLTLPHAIPMPQSATNSTLNQPAPLSHASSGESDMQNGAREIVQKESYVLSQKKSPVKDKGSSHEVSEDDPVHDSPSQRLLSIATPQESSPSEPFRSFGLPTATASDASKTTTKELEVDHSDEDSFAAWSRSPSPALEPSGESIHWKAPVVDEGWDAAEEMDAHEEEGEFARFISQVKGKDFETVRQEIDEEIRSLNQQKKAAMRDSEDITQQMVSQIMLMLRLFGIPYITAPMEAEAQCAELVTLDLVEGIITDDSDVFLFGGLRVFKNMFNQSKTVECFLLPDLARELGLERDTLIRLAYLLGSDYVEGLPGVGPVVAMELLKEFPGEDGLHKFKDWWTKVQTGRDKDEDNKSKFRKRFKKKFKDLYLAPDWPNPAVRDAYYHPTVDSSEEPFKWGLPDLDALRDFFNQELSWNQAKVDDLLLPIIQKMRKRGQAAALNKQSNLNDFLEVTSGTGSYAPRKRQAYASKRLQEVVSEFRANQRNRPSTTLSDPAGSGASGDEYVEEPANKKRKKLVTGASKGKGKEKAQALSGRSASNAAVSRRSRGRGKSTISSVMMQKPKSNDEIDSEGDDQTVDTNAIPSQPLNANLRPRPRPRAVRDVSE